MSKKPKDEDEEIQFGEGIDTDELATLGNGEIQVELTEKEKLALEAEARKEVAAAIKAAKSKEFKAAAKKRLQSEAMFKHGKDDTGEDLDEVYLDLASSPKYIMLDGTVYYSGRRYKKRKAVIAVLKELMDRGWRQEAARRGEKVENMGPVRMAPQEGLRYH